MNRRGKGKPAGNDAADYERGASSRAACRAERLAAELRSNLSKRKDQARARTRADRDRPD